jgi:hypothetical protein
LTVGTLPEHLTSCGLELDADPHAFGELRDSTDALDDFDELRRRMNDEGYLYLPQFLDRERIISAREYITAKFGAEGVLDAAHPFTDAIAVLHSGFQAGSVKTRADLTRDNVALTEMLADPALAGFYRRFLAGPVRRYDRTQLRARTPAPNSAAKPHCDSVFMNRGTKQLYTAWIPLGDIPTHVGGLMVLEHSLHIERLRHEYADLDIDTYCTDFPGAAEWMKTATEWGGQLSDDPVALRDELGGRWLTSDFQLGDLLTFTIYTIHASLDNVSTEMRLSIDTRFQLASEAFDERWMGENAAGEVEELNVRIC